MIQSDEMIEFSGCPMLENAVLMAHGELAWSKSISCRLHLLRCASCRQQYKDSLAIRNGFLALYSGASSPYFFGGAANKRLQRMQLVIAAVVAVGTVLYAITLYTGSPSIGDGMANGVAGAVEYEKEKPDRISPDSGDCENPKAGHMRAPR